MSSATPVTATIPLSGPYDLGEVALMGFGHRDERSFDGVMRLAFCLDGTHEVQVGVELRQAVGRLELVIHERSEAPPGDPERVATQVARVVSADHDGEAYARICTSDPALERVFSVAPGFRPALFYSPYEAAVWSVLSARRSRQQAIGLRERLAAEHGATFELAGEAVPAVPTPSRLLAVHSFPGLPADRIPRLHAVAEAAQRGHLSVERLSGQEPAEARSELQRLPGIGPFYSSLILLRACGLIDLLPDEAHVREAAARAYGRSLSDGDFAAVAEGWRPYRTWVGVMLRALDGRGSSP